MIDFENLTLRELEVVEELINTTNINKSAKKLCISRATMTTHLRSIYLKLDIHSLPELIKFFYHKELQKLYKENKKLKSLLIGGRINELNN
jgi:DNA-binding NarL/FixJ family response regulator